MSKRPTFAYKSKQTTTAIPGSGLQIASRSDSSRKPDPTKGYRSSTVGGHSLKKLLGNMATSKQVPAYFKQTDKSYTYKRCLVSGIWTDPGLEIKTKQPFDIRERTAVSREFGAAWAPIAVAATNLFNEPIGLLGHVFVTRGPFCLDRPEDGGGAGIIPTYRKAVDGGEGDNYTELYIDEMIQDVDVDIMSGVATGLGQAINKEGEKGPLYVTVAIFESPRGAISGRSYEMGLVAIAMGLPGNLIYSGGIAGGRTTELAEKCAVAADLGARIFVSNPDEDSLAEANKQLNMLQFNLYSMMPSFDYFAPIGFCGDLKFIAAMALLTASSGFGRLRRDAADLIETDADVANKAGDEKVQKIRRDQFAEVTVGDKVRTVTKKDVLEALKDDPDYMRVINSYVEEVGFKTPGLEDAVKKYVKNVDDMGWLQLAKTKLAADAYFHKKVKPKRTGPGPTKAAKGVGTDLFAQMRARQAAKGAKK